MNKGLMIKIGIGVGAIILVISIFASANNRAISYEEQINGAKAQVETQEKRRADLIGNLVDAAVAYGKYESSTLKEIVAARSNVDKGNVEEALTSINVVAEAYPELKASDSYNKVMTELALTENLIAQSRDNYTIQVRSYNKFVKSFPNNVVLGFMGYEKIDAEYRDYGAPEDAPQNLFGE